jgi:hypothetical protein
MSRGRCTTLDFVEVNNLQTVGCSRVAVRSIDRAKGCAQRQATHAPHSVDANFHLSTHLLSFTILELWM